jgi:hypothetical protein
MPPTLVTINEALAALSTPESSPANAGAKEPIANKADRANAIFELFTTYLPLICAQKIIAQQSK